ncbi:MAG TPA: hypothetical protein VFC44_15340 [Candidatus Saccharimonadales bacterium]|nr:hypothetical protein [Candidatus Saccharimonadales bacterium]
MKFKIENIISVLAVLAGINQAAAQTWTGTSARTDVNWLSVASSSDGTKLVAAGNYPTWSAYVSTNSGGTWIECLTNIGFSSVASSSDGTKLAGGQEYSGFIFTSTNSGGTWTQTSAPQRFWEYLVCSADGTKLLAVGQAGQPGPVQLYASRDSGNTWTVTSAPATNWSGIATSADGVKLVASIGGNGVFYTSTDSGTNWTAQTNEPTIWWGAMASSADGTKLVATTVGTGIYTSTNSGTNWTQQTNAPDQDWTAVACSADGTKLIAAVRSGFGDGAPGPIYTSSDSGVTWTSNNLAPEFWTSVASSANGSNFVACSSRTTPTTNGYSVLDQIVTSTPHLWMPPPMPSGTNVVITWPWPADGFQLQQKSNAMAATWTTITNSPLITNFQNSVTLPLASIQSLFQLKK